MESPWWQWCRLCAKEDLENINISNDMAIATAIGKYFWVNIKPTDKTQHICRDCLKLINQLVEFTDRVNKVQAMLLMLQNQKNSDPIDLNEVRLQYDLLEDDFEHFAAMKSPKEEVFFNENSMLRYSEDEHEKEDVKEIEITIQNNICEEEMIPKKRKERISYNELDEFNAEEIFGDQNSKEDCKEITYDKNCEQENHCDDQASILESNQKKKTTLNSSKTEQESPIFEPRYKCRFCGKIYKNATSFRKHMSETHNIEPDIADFKCEECNKIFTTARQLIIHNRKHLPLEQKLDVPCQQCDKKFSSEAVMKQHISSVHLNEKPFMCDECGISLSSLASLNDHKTTHSNEFPYECDICKKKFKHKTRLKTHMDTHNATVYECNQCGVRLNTKRTLKMHMLVHSEERNYKCHFCTAKFKRGKALKNHLIIHLGLRPYKCNYCQKTFTNGSNCRSHKKRFHRAALDEEEAAGLKTEPIKVPKISELRASTKKKES